MHFKSLGTILGPSRTIEYIDDDVRLALYEKSSDDSKVKRVPFFSETITLHLLNKFNFISIHC